MKKPADAKHVAVISHFLKAGLLVLVVWLTALSVAYRLSPNPQFGEIFDAVNALFSGLAFAGVIIAVLIQSHELELQRKELEMTRQELVGQRAELATQNALRMQEMRTTLPANVRFNVGLSDQKIAISAVNLGKSAATKVGGKMTITRATLPDLESIGEEKTYEFDFNDLNPPPREGEPSLNGTNCQLEIPGFTTKEMESVMRMEQTITFKATFRYDNGFGDKKISEQCGTFLWSPMVKNINGAGYAARGFQDCQQFPVVLENVLKAMREQGVRIEE